MRDESLATWAETAEVKGRKTLFRPVEMSLEGLLGTAYADTVTAARAYLSGEDRQSLRALAAESVDFFPAAIQSRLIELLAHVGETCVPPLADTPPGATTDAFRANAKLPLAPSSGLGYYRCTEDGRLFLIAKSAHYHAALGHAFPGYRLLDYARRLGIPNATHNNTRGYITRCLEHDLVAAAAGLDRDDHVGIGRLLARTAPGDLNRVVNLETGSVAAEAALKMALSRFYRPQASGPAPAYEGRVPVFLVVGDHQGELLANYHGTTIMAQTLRGMWPELGHGLARQELMLVRAVRPDDLVGLKSLLSQYNQGRYKVAAFIHELVLMNYGGTRLSRDFVAEAYALCRAADVVTIVDEIQTGIWSPEVFLFREYGVRPDVVVIGKGFPGGEFAASRVLLSAGMDLLPQFGALVTNGQEELASLAYLITLRWAQANAEVIGQVGQYYEDRLRALAASHTGVIDKIEGCRHLAGIYFRRLDTAQRFVAELNRGGIDISVQAYKTGCPPSALTKLPLVVGFEVVDWLLARMEAVLV